MEHHRADDDQDENDCDNHLLFILTQWVVDETEGNNPCFGAMYQEMRRRVFVRPRPNALLCRRTEYSPNSQTSDQFGAKFALAPDT